MLLLQENWSTEFGSAAVLRDCLLIGQTSKRLSAGEQRMVHGRTWVTSVYESL
jgi:hypothetical protein